MRKRVVIYVDNLTQMFKYFQTYLFVFHLEHPFDVANSLLHESWRSVVQRYAIRECALINEMRLATQF